VGATSQPLGFPAPLARLRVSPQDPPAGQAVLTGCLAAAPQRFVTVQTAFATAPASKCRSSLILSQPSPLSNLLRKSVAISLVGQAFLPVLPAFVEAGLQAGILECGGLTPLSLGRSLLGPPLPCHPACPERSRREPSAALAPGKQAQELSRVAARDLFLPSQGTISKIPTRSEPRFRAAAGIS